ncbi:unnamed protein product, partial [Mesorhabditis spiculigera]
MHSTWAVLLLFSGILNARALYLYSYTSIFLLSPLLLTGLYFLLRNKQCPREQAMAFFADFMVGGHRGSPWKEPENSIEAFLKCKDEGCQLVEFDIEVTKDGILVIMHDETTDRTTDKGWVVCERTLNELKELKLKFIPHGGGAVEYKGTVPTLAETVELCKSKSIKMLFDVKHFDENVIQTIALLFSKYSLYEVAIVSSFNPLVPYFIKRRDQKILTGYTWRRFCNSTKGECDLSSKYNSFLNAVFELFDELNHQLTSHFFLPVFLGVEMVLVNHHDLSQLLVYHARYHGLQVVAWTSNDPVEALWIREYLKIPFLTDSMDAINRAIKNVWREQFLEDRCCTKEEIHKEFFISSVPHILLNVVLIIYWYIGAVVLHQIEPKLRYKSLHESALFCFITTSTIGWGNIVPATYYGKCFIILYIMIGTPLTYVVLGNNGQFLVDLYWILKKSYATKKKGEIYGGEMPLVISYGLLLLHICLGALLYSLWVDHKSFFESFYLTFISITTIGYGDEIPATDRRWEFYVTMLYLAIGVIIVTMVVGSMQGLFQRMHNLGRNGISGSQAVEIWFGGRAMRVGELVHIVAEHFSVEPAKLRHVLKDLDEILEAATAETESIDGDTSPLMEGHPEHQLTV